MPRWMREEMKELWLRSPNAFLIGKRWSRCCIVLDPNSIRVACGLIEGFGVTWISSWKDGQRCVWIDDEVTLTKLTTFGYSGRRFAASDAESVVAAITDAELRDLIEAHSRKGRARQP